MQIHSQTRHRMMLLEGQVMAKLVSLFEDDRIDVASVAQGGMVRFAALYMKTESRSVVEMCSSYIALDAFSWTPDDEVKDRVVRDLRKKIRTLISQFRRQYSVKS